MSRSVGNDGAALADQPGWLSDLDRSVSLLDGLAVADLADSPVAETERASAAMPGLITGFLFSGQAWPGSQAEISARNGGAGTAEWIRGFTHSLMDLDFQYGGGHVRRVLLCYFRTEIVPLLRAQHPERVRGELFSAAAEVAEMLGWSAYDAGRHGAAQRYFAHGLRLAGEARELAVRALDPAVTPPRTAAFISLVDAAAALRGGDLDEALALASGAVKLAGSQQSARYLRYVSGFHAAVHAGGHAADPRVGQFISLITAAGQAADAANDVAPCLAQPAPPVVQLAPTLDQAVRDLHAAGHSQRSIARDLNLGRRKVKQIIDREAA